MIDDDEWEAVDGMRIGRGKIYPSVTYFTTNPT
jgi:hypothetical protein